VADADVRDLPRAVAAATATASALGLTVDRAVVLHVSNRLALRLLPSDTVGRVVQSEPTEPSTHARACPTEMSPPPSRIATRIGPQLTIR
jgi:uncharacterized protein (DUF2384 family)